MQFYKKKKRDKIGQNMNNIIINIKDPKTHSYGDTVKNYIRSKTLMWKKYQVLFNDK